MTLETNRPRSTTGTCSPAAASPSSADPARRGPHRRGHRVRDDRQQGPDDHARLLGCLGARGRQDEDQVQVARDRRDHRPRPLARPRVGRRYRRARQGRRAAPDRHDALLEGDAAGLLLGRLRARHAALGSYVAVMPQGGGEATREFQVAAQAPPAVKHRDALAVELRTDDLGSIGIGSPVLYRTIRVGEVVGHDLVDRDGGAGHGFLIHTVIDKPYAHLVREGTEFWNASGLDVSFGTDGLQVQLASLTSLLSGGIAFDTAPWRGKGPAAPSGTRFDLHESYSDVNAKRKLHGMLEVVVESRSARGLAENSPVTYRSVTIGHTGEVVLSPDSASVKIPVYIEKRYAPLVRTSTRFWNATGVQAHVGLDGVDIDVDSLTSVLSGGLGLATPGTGDPVDRGHLFALATSRTRSGSRGRRPSGSAGSASRTAWRTCSSRSSRAGPACASSSSPTRWRPSATARRSTTARCRSVRSRRASSRRTPDDPHRGPHRRRVRDARAHEHALLEHERHPRAPGHRRPDRRHRLGRVAAARRHRVRDPRRSGPRREGRHHVPAARARRGLVARLDAHDLGREAEARRDDPPRAAPGRAAPPLRRRTPPGGERGRGTDGRRRSARRPARLADARRRPRRPAMQATRASSSACSDGGTSGVGGVRHERHRLHRAGEGGSSNPASRPRLRRQLEAAARPREAADTLPAVAYTSPVMYARERERILERSWLCAGRVDRSRVRATSAPSISSGASWSSSATTSGRCASSRACAGTGRPRSSKAKAAPAPSAARTTRGPIDSTARCSVPRTWRAARASTARAARCRSSGGRRDS